MHDRPESATPLVAGASSQEPSTPAVRPGVAVRPAEQSASPEENRTPPTAFISHSSRDAQTARAIVNALEAAGVSCWIAPRDIPPGADFNAAIMDGIESCRVLLFLSSRHSVESDPVTREVERAVAKKIPVIPIRLDQEPLSKSLEFLITRNQWVDAFPPPIDRHLDAIVEAARRRLGLDRAAPVPTVDAAPEFVGPYRILGQLGEGGMGTVYKAEQRTPVKRIVALKVIKLGMATKEVIARFDSERQALARMDSPHVAKVLDAGADDRGRPYFVMEYVPGVPITQFADQKTLSIKQRLELFTQVCDAISHAHTKAIIHRDIKSTNVLAYLSDGKPLVKVIDFGIAKAVTGDKLTDRTLNTQMGFAMGTLGSMSPEQAQGSPDIDTRTDVYSLGALLYELLAGAPPFSDETLAKAADEEVRRIIREDDPPKPSTRVSSLGESGKKLAEARRMQVDSLARQLRSELEWIPLKAMRKERDRRYATPQDLADDIRNYLEKRPLQAGPESLTYRWKKTFNRRRGSILGAAAIVTLLILGVIGYVLSIQREQHKTQLALGDAQKQRALAVKNANAAEKQRKLAVENAELAESRRKDADAQRQRAEESAQLAAKRFDEKRQALDSMLAAFSEQALKSQPGTQPVRKFFLEKGIEQYQALSADAAGDFTVALRTGDAYRELGLVEKELGHVQEALANLNRSIDLCREAVAAAPEDDAVRTALGDACFQLGQALFEQQSYDAALPYVEESVAIYEDLSARHPDVALYKARHGRGLIRQASLISDEAKKPLLEDQGVALLTAATEQEPGNAPFLLDLARGVNNRATALADFQARLPEMQRAQRLAVEALKLDGAVPLGCSLYSVFTTNVVDLLVQIGRTEEALLAMGEALLTVRHFARDNPAVLSGQVAFADLMTERARILRILQRNDDAVAQYQEIIAAYDSLAQRDPGQVRYPLASVNAARLYGEFLANLGRQSEAAGVYGSVIRRSSELMEAHPTSNDLLNKLLLVHVLQGEMSFNAANPAAAEATYLAGTELYGDAAADVERLSEETRYRYLQCCGGAISACTARGDDRKAIELGERLIVPFDPGALEDVDYAQSYLKALADLALCYAKVGDYAKAVATRQGVVTRGRELLAGDITSNWYVYQLVFGAHHNLAENYRSLGDDRGAFDALKDYLAETAPYVDGSDHSTLLAETETFSEENLRRRWEAHDASFGAGMKRFTVPVDFNGMKFPFHVYVAESWSFLEDQFTYVERVRGGKVPAEVRESFEKLYKIAKENNVSYQDLCVYALAPAEGAESSDAIGESRPLQGGSTSIESDSDVLAELARLRNAVATAGNDPEPRRRLAAHCGKLAEDGIRAGNYFRAAQQIEDAERTMELAGPSSRTHEDAAIADYIDYLKAAAAARQEKFEEAYTMALECVHGRKATEELRQRSIREAAEAEMLAAGADGLALAMALTQPSLDPGPDEVDPATLVPPGAQEFLLGWICACMDRSVEATSWYLRSIEAEHDPARRNLCLLYLRSRLLVDAIPLGTRLGVMAQMPNFATELAAVAEELKTDMTNKDSESEDYFGATRGFALASLASTACSGEWDNEEHRMRATDYADQAIECLTSEKLVLDDAMRKELATSPDFAAIRDRPEFQALLEVEEPAAADESREPVGAAAP